MVNYLIKEILGKNINNSMRLKIGDIFTVAVSDLEVGFGQILAFPTKSTLIICLFDLKLARANNYDVTLISKADVCMLGYSLDAKLYHKHWLVIGNIEPSKGILLPYNKVGSTPDDMFLTDYKGRKLRKCSNEEFDLLNYQTVIAPVRYENALKAFFNLGEWKVDDYDKLLYKYSVASNEIYNSKRIA
jgi:hypothetical protein